MALPQYLDELTPEQQAEANQQLQSAPDAPSAPDGTDPLDALDPHQYLELWNNSKDESLNPVNWAKANPDRAQDPAVESKLADISALAREQGFKFEHISAKNAIKGVWDAVVGGAKWALRAGDLALTTGPRYALSGDKDKTLDVQAKKAIELGASTETAVTGLADLARKGAEKVGAVVGRIGNKLKNPDANPEDEPDAGGFFTPPEDETPEQRVNKFRAAKSRADMMEQISKGEGATMGTLTGDFAKILEQKGHKVDPEVVSSLAMGDPVTFLAFTGGFKVLSAAGKEIAKVGSRTEATQLVTQLRAAQQATRSAIKAEGAAARDLAKQQAAFTERGPLAAPGLADAPDALRATQVATTGAQAGEAVAQAAVQASPVARGAQAVQRAGQVAGQVASQVGNKIGAGLDRVADASIGLGVGTIGTGLRTVGAMTDFVRSFIPPLATPRALSRGAELATNVGKGVQKVAGTLLEGNKATYSPRIRLMSDLVRSAPDIAAGAGKGFLLFDVPLAAATSETPDDTAHMPAFGAVLGGLGKIPGAVQRGVQSQLATPKDYNWGNRTAIRDYGSLSALDKATKMSAESAQDPAKMAWLSAIRQFVEPTGSQIHWISDKPTLEGLLRRYVPGREESWYKEAADQRGVALKIRDDAGKQQNVVLLSDVTAAPHESVHLFQDVLGDAAMRKVDDLIYNEYLPIWDQVGENYANRFFGEKGFGDQYLKNGEGWQEAVLDIARGNKEWRNELTPEQVDAEASHYLSREISAEVMDTVLRNNGPALADANNLIGRMARIMGKTLMGLGIEPFEGVRSEGQGVPVSMKGAEGVREAFKGGIEDLQVEQRRNAVINAPDFGRNSTKPTPGAGPVPPTSGTGGTGPSTPATPAPPTPATPAPPTPSAAAVAAHEIAASAPTSTAVRGGRSRQEILTDVANAIESRGGVSVDYISAPGEPAGSIAQNLATRRAVIEAFRDMPDSARALWEKNFFPEQVVQTASGIQVMGWTPEVFAANAHKLAKTLTATKQVALSPYPIDIKTGTFTEHGWRQLFEDANGFMKNQQAGLTGAGNMLVTPPEVVARGFRAPEETGATPASISQNRADVISSLFGIKLPKTPRVGKVYPRNLAGQEVSAATEPGRVSSPVESRKPFAGPKAAELGIEGREINEVNPFRATLEKAGVNVDAIEAIQRLNVDRIADVTPLPVEGVPFRANEFTLQAGFQPKAGDKALYDDLTGQFSKLSLEDKFGAKGTALRKQIEEVKNRSNGMPPAEDGAPAPEGAKFQPKTDSGHALQDAGFEVERTGFPGFRAVTIRKDGQVVGEILSSRSHENPSEVVIGGVDVKPSFRRQGIGEAMYRELLTDLQGDGVKTVTGYPISAAPIKVREKLLPGTKYEAPGKSLTMQEAILGTPEVAAQLGLPPEIGVKMTSKLTANLKFQPSNDPRALKSAAVQLRDGRIFEGAFHPFAFEKAEKVWRAEHKGNDLSISDTVDGYVTNDGKFLNREDAYDRALELKQMSAADGVKEGLAYDFTGDTGALETDSFDQVRRFQPKTEAGKKLEASGLKLVRKTFLDNGDGAGRIEVQDSKGDRIAYIETMDIPVQEAGQVPTAEVMMVRVNDGHRRKGIAETLYREALTDLQQQGVKEVTGYIIRSGPARIREKLLPGLSQFSQAGRPLPVEEAMKQVSGSYGVEVRTRLPEDAKFQPKLRDGEELEHQETNRFGDNSYSGRFLLSKNGKVVSSLSYEVDRGATHVLRVNTQEDYRNKGAATSLYEALRDKLRSEGINEVSGEVTSSDPVRIRQRVFNKTEDLHGAVTKRRLKEFDDLDEERLVSSQFQPKPNDEVRGIANDYNTVRTGRELPKATVATPDPKLLARIADYYENAKSDPGNEKVKASYDALAEETIAQWEAIEDAGYTLEPYAGKGEPYKNSDEMTADIRDNKHLYFLKTEGNIEATADNPMLAPSGIKDYPVNDVFRAVHDFFGHAKEGLTFGPKGEFNAWREHSELYSPEAQGALATETLAQNAWVNFGKHIRDAESPAAPADRPFAEQKNIVLPDSLIAAAKDEATTMQFAPKKDEPRAIKGAAILIERPGKEPVIVEGIIHADAYEKAWDQKLLKEGADDARTYDGFVTNDGKFLDREEAFDRARELKQLSGRGATAIAREFGPESELEAVTFSNFRRFQPTMAEWEARKNKKSVAKIGTGNAAKGETFEVTHYSSQSGLTRVDPKFFGKGKATPTDLRGSSKSFFFVKGSDFGQDANLFKDAGLTEYTGSISGDKIYDLRAGKKDVLGWRKEINREKADNLVTDAGYAGMILDTADGRQVVAMFKPIPVSKVGGAKFQPQRNDELGMDLAPLPLSTREISEMNQKQKRVYYPEAVVPKSQGDTVPSDIVGSPLYKRQSSEGMAATAFAKRLVEFAKDHEKDPAYKLGLRWYSDFTPMLKEKFGKDAPLMAELLAATSPNTNPQVNFGYAYDALRSMQTGRFAKIVPKFEAGLEMMTDGAWENWYAKELRAGKVAAPPETPTPAAFMAHWIDKYDLKPRQSNGALYGMHGTRVLQVLARRWMDLNAGPKTRNFVGNLLGEGHEATIDVWADRTMRWAGYEGLNDRWRILPENSVGVSDPDFAFGQLAFRRVAKELGILPDALQGGLWFAEKKRWSDNGWGRLDLGDFRTEMANVPYLESGFHQRVKKTAASKKEKPTEQLGLDVEPRKR
jgi:ribosomal protein S18 acetylase RimI-like enzyme